MSENSFDDVCTGVYFELFFCDLALFRFLSLLSFPPFLGLFFFYIGSMCDGLFNYYLIIFSSFYRVGFGLRCRKQRQVNDEMGFFEIRSY